MVLAAGDFVLREVFKTVFYFLHELKQRSKSSDVTGRHQRPVDSDVTEGVITTRSNRMKFRLRVQHRYRKPIF